MQKSCSCETQNFGLEETLGAPLVHLSTQGREDFLLRFQSMPGWPHVTQLSQSQQPHQQVLLSETFSWPHSCLLHHAGIQSLNPVHSGQVVILQRWAMKASWVPFCCLEPPLVPSIMLLHSGKPAADAAFQSWICQPSELGAKYTVFIISHLSLDCCYCSTEQAKTFSFRPQTSALSLSTFLFLPFFLVLSATLE